MGGELEADVRALARKLGLERGQLQFFGHRPDAREIIGAMDDIWCGIVSKRISDHLGYAVNSGSPAVFHRCASNVWDNLLKEAVSLRLNEELWAAIDAITLTGTTVAECYTQIASQLRLSTPFLPKLQTAMCQWAALFKKAPRSSEVVLDRAPARSAGDVALP